MRCTKTAPRRSCNRGAYKALVKPEPIIAEKSQSEWEKGCKWAAIAIAFTWGPMLVIGAWLGWM